MTTTPNLPGPERVKELRRLLAEGCFFMEVNDTDMPDLLAILDEHAALQAENERLQKERDEWAKVAHDLSIELAKAKGNKK